MSTAEEKFAELVGSSVMGADEIDPVNGGLLPMTVVSSTLHGRTGTQPIFGGAADIDLELIGSRTFDGQIQELAYRPTPH